jgi:hypothetical protein
MHSKPPHFETSPTAIMSQPITLYGHGAFSLLFPKAIPLTARYYWSQSMEKGCNYPRGAQNSVSAKDDG